jgi:DNA adenine methylase
MGVMTAPPLPYYGGKGILGPKIAALFPKHLHYVEPYCGALSVLLAKPRSPMETVNDLDGDLMTFWAVLRERPDELAHTCALTPHSRAEFRRCSEWMRGADRMPIADDLEVARRVWVCLTQGRGGVLRNTGWRHYVKPTGTTSFPDYLLGYLGRIHAAAERLASVSLDCLPALDVIAKYGREPDVLLYVDPPYLGSTRGTWGNNGYRHEMRDEARHRELGEALHACRAAVVLSGYPSSLYDGELYPDWHRETFLTGTGQGEGWSNRTEVLWSNRPLGEPHLFSEVTE